MVLRFRVKLPTHLEPSFKKRLFAYYLEIKQSLTDMSLPKFIIPLVVKCAEHI